MKPTASQIQRKYSLAYSIKTSWDTEYREIFEYCMPSRDGYAKATAGETIDKNYQDRRENLYSSVGEQAATEFVNTMQEVLAPPMSSWISLEAGYSVPEDERENKNKELDKLCEYANEYKNNSSFDMAFSEFCYDVGAGTGVMLVLPGRPRKPISFKAIPIREVCLEEGVDGEVRGVYRKYGMKNELLGAAWKELKGREVAPGCEDKEITIIESTYFDYDMNIWHYQVIDDGEGTELVHREYKTNPYIVLRWNKCAGEPYGRGVLMTAINDIKTLNLIKFYSLRSFAYQLPILLAQEDAMLDVDSFDPTPLTLNIVPDTKSSIMPLDISPKYDAESYKTSELTMDIKKNTYTSTLPNEGNRELTATEIRARIAELRKSLLSVFGRLIAEFQIPIVQRIFDVLSDTDTFGMEHKEKFNVLDIDGLKWKVNIITPIGKIVRYQEATAILATISTLAQFDPSGRIIQQSVELEEAIYEYLRLSGMPDKLIKTKQQSQVTQEQQAEADQAATESAAEMEVQVANAKELGKAQAKEQVSV